MDERRPLARTRALLLRVNYPHQASARFIKRNYCVRHAMFPWVKLLYNYTTDCICLYTEAYLEIRYV